MNELKIGRYADVRCDLAFKRCFGSEQHKPATIGLINAMIPGINITDVEFEPTELQGLSDEDRRGIIDVLCHSEDGAVFIVEMQRAPHPFFRERTLYYSSLYMLNQAQRGDWDFHIRPSYVLAFVDFPLPKMGVSIAGSDIPMVRYAMTDAVTGAKMPGSTEFYFFDLESFVKKETEIANNQEKWLYLMRNSGTLTGKPASIIGPDFDDFFVAAEIAGFTKEDRIKYEKDMVTKLDMKLALQYAEQKGLATGKKEGIAEGIRQTATNLKAMGMSVADIAKATGLSEKEIQEL